MARHMKGSLCGGEGSGRAAPIGHHAVRAQLMGCGLGDNEKGISAQRAGGGKHNTAQAGQVSALTRTPWRVRSSDAPCTGSSGITGSSLVAHGSRGEQGMFALRWPCTVGTCHPISQKQSVNWSVTASLQENLGAALIAAITVSPTASGTIRQTLSSSALQGSSLPFLQGIKIILLRQLHHREQQDILFIGDSFPSLI